MASWDAICEALAIDPDEVARGATITRRALYRMNPRIFVPARLDLWRAYRLQRRKVSIPE